MQIIGDDQDISNLNRVVSKSSTIEGLPTFDPRRVVHAFQIIAILKPSPHVSGPGWKFKKRLTIRENKPGVIIENKFFLVNPNDTP
ncbi:hypothetical protein BC834DRAFT_976140 [Gloeopeniophorella convolvens]|nr:hypothetical protein BC834DRAFT_976140 [Gloeopeniophorella convolvens]